MDFITCKDDTTKITNFNISVAVTDAFMAAVEADGEYDLIHPKTKAAGRAAHRPARSGRRSSTAPGRPASRASSSSTGPTTTIRSRTSAPTRRPIPAASSRCCRTTSATSARSTSAASSRTARSTGMRLRQVIHLSHPLPRERHRRQQLPAARDRRACQADPAHRPRRHGLGRPAGPARHPLRLRRRGRARAARSCSSWTTRRRWSRSGSPSSAACSRVGAEHLGPGRDLRPGRRRASGSVPMQPAAELQRHHRGAHRHHLDHRRVQLGDRAAVRRGVHAEPGRRPDAGRERGLRRHRARRKAGTPTS